MPDPSQVIHAWSRQASITGQLHHFMGEANPGAFPRPLIAQGALMNYGDCALGTQMLSMRGYCRMLDFDEQKGRMECQAGITIGEILRHSIPKGWMLPVCPGTQHVTLGGAIASDVHGKNHPHLGCFSELVHSMTLLSCLPNQDGADKVLHCSATENSELFHASCGGMGLTGIIVSATINLVPLDSLLVTETRIKTSHLVETLAQFEDHQASHYTMAWLDLSAPRKKIGRGIFSIGEHSPSPDAQTFRNTSPSRFSIPFSVPVIKPWSIKAFNALVYHKQRQRQHSRQVQLDHFLFPLDRIRHWNRLYGRKGFVQYQCFLPEEKTASGLHSLLECIQQSGQVSSLAVLKRFGKQNHNFLSFPGKGYSLAMDFSNTAETHTLLDKLDDILLAHNGRIYLAKDARMSRKMFECGYPKAEAFRELRRRYGMERYFASQLSERLAL